jgi:hypothetical protein
LSNTPRNYFVTPAYNRLARLHDNRQRAPDGRPSGGSWRVLAAGCDKWPIDVSIAKKFKITETVSFDLRADMGNFTNHPSFDNPTAVLNNALFGRINDTVANTARRIQLAGRLYF